MNIESLLLYLSTWLLVALTPGPAVIYVVSQTARYGLQAGLRGIVGIQLGNLIVFLCIAVGILLAYRSVGIIAVIWTVFVPLTAKVVLGQHTPLDIFAGALIGLSILFAMQWLLKRWGNRFLDPVVKWTMNNSALAAALLFIVLFEVTNTLDDVRQIGKVGKDVVKHVVGKQ